MSKAIIPCGYIYSGKSTVAKNLSTSQSWDIVSFGRFVVQVARSRHIEETRASYQKLGLELLNSLGEAKFLDEVLTYFQPTTDTVLFDGVRNAAMLSEIRKRYDTSLVIFLEVSDSIRYQRYVSTIQTGSALSYADFVDVSYHPIEQGIAELRHEADVIIDASAPIKEVLQKVEDVLHDSSRD